MAIEKYIAAAGLGFYIMFIAEILTLYYFIIEPQIEIEPAPKVLQYISIGLAPALILTGVSFILAKRCNDTFWWSSTFGWHVTCTNSS